MIARHSIHPPLAAPDPTASHGWPAQQPPSPAREAAHAALQAQAGRTAVRAVKDRAASYLAFPEYLDNIRRGFVASGLTPDQLTEFAKEVLRQELAAHSRFELVPIKKINAKAAIVAGRYLRAKDNQLAKRRAS